MVRNFYKKFEKVWAGLALILLILPNILLFAPEEAHAFWGIGDAGVDAASNIANGATISGTTGAGAAAGAANAGSSASILGINLKQLAQEVLKQTLMAVARRALQQMTKSTVNWINNGFHGSPLFVENPQSFFQDIGKSEIKNLVTTFGYDPLRFPYGKAWALNTINSYNQTLANNSAYTLSNVINDPVLLRNYQTNFNVGGWNGFLINTQYPQNNYLGFQLLATDELARRYQGVTQNTAQKVQTTLQQGQGFLSPQTCPSNPDYNNGINEFQRPSFQYDVPFEPPSYEDDPEAYMDYRTEWDQKKAAAQTKWSKENTCTGGLVSTTPGSVVSSQITRALNIPADSTLQAMGLGNALSAIFDALLNKFIGDGLNALASTANTAPPKDNFSYSGLTLGSPSAAGTNSTWDTGPDEPIVLDKFKTQLTDDIAKTQEEIALFDNADPLNPGILQMEKILPIQTQTLDQCIPGPDKGWEGRLKDEETIAERPFGLEAGQQDESKVRAVNGVTNDLKFAVTSFQDWLTTKMIGVLPSAVLYMDEVKKIDDLSQDTKTTTDAKRKKAETLARLKAFQQALSIILTQPAPGSTEEKNMIAIKKQYDAVRSSISSTITIEDTRSTLDSEKAQLKNLQDLTALCLTERTAAGWGKPDASGKGASVLSSAVGKRISITKLGGDESEWEEQVVSYTTTGTEVEQFCSVPIQAGYSHGDIIRRDDSNSGGKKFTFRNPRNDLGDSGYEDLPIVNAKLVYGDQTSCGFLGFGNCDNRISINIECSSLFRASSINYTHAGDFSF